MTNETANRLRLPWWLESGPEHCEFCLHGYHYEAVYHCMACDRPVCPVCVVEVRATRALICPECATED